ncbi:hypothetical protein QVD17_40169 [Tagetes erecta]|uniref:Dof zinc finger protein n=1 Tax=Tagetes erecta TaxID=13708 RepID=A0AAD8JTL5_TARER|nr:hypothetical protein QVD17_40169 [Tagetes erecta]
MNVAGLHHHHHQQDISSQTLESMLVCTKPQEDKKPRPPEETLKCPRCDSINTKFCYYNNYSLTQPRYFCKSCRRYWTKGGTLRNVPVGGGCRKNKRSSSSSSSASPSSSSLCATSSSSKMRDHNLNLIIPNSNNQLLAGVPHLPYDSTTCSDLSLAFARLQSQANGSMGYDHFDHTDHHLSTNVDPLGFLGFLENTNTNTNNRFHDHNHHVFYNLDQQQQVLNNPMRFHGDQDQELISSSAATTTVPAAVKQEACNMVGLWGGSSWQMQGGDQGTMVHEVESAAGRSMIGGWINNGIGSTNWNGLINSPLM